jgi:hypothetical protein
MDEKKTRKSRKSEAAAAVKNLPVKGESAKKVKGGIHVTKKTDSSSPDLFLRSS